MKELSKNNIYIVESFEQGYDINKEGHLVRKDSSVLEKFRKHSTGYCIITFRLPSNKKANVKIHKLQAYKKYGDKIFEEGIVVRHRNGNKEDNSWDNILIGTASDNQMDIPEEIRIKSATKVAIKHQENIRSYEERCLIYEDLKNGIPYSQIISKYKVSKGTLSFMKNKSIEYKEYLKSI